MAIVNDGVDHCLSYESNTMDLKDVQFAFMPPGGWDDSEEEGVGFQDRETVQDLNPAFPANRGLKELHILRNASITNGSVVCYRIVSWDWAQ